VAFTIDYADDAVLEWHATDTDAGAGVEVREVTDYTPTIYAGVDAGADAAADDDTGEMLDDLAAVLAERGDVAATARERWRLAFRTDPEPVQRVDVTSIDRVRPVAGWIRRRGRPGTYRLFNVDFSREFRYCLERGRDPVPDRPLRVLELDHPVPGAPEAPVTTLRIGSGDETGDGSEVIDGDDPARVIEAVETQLARQDPDVLVVSGAALVPALFGTAAALDRKVRLGRRPGYEQLAGASTYESYGQVGHSPARYSVPGRAVVDRSNTFFYRETNLAGCLDLVGRSRKPLQELSWASIGNVLTAIQIRAALDRGVLVPWKSWRHEFPKTMRQLHEADRGGFTFAPAVGVHDDVHELDFSSLYPNIIRTRNVSPETIRCDCHADRADVPGLGYSICDEQGYLPEVLAPIIDDRDEIKKEIERTDDPARREALAGQSSALKWILVSCFGYQGFSNAKFGRIECHEAINAFARELILDAKERLEAAGWRVVHGIVDSLWVTAREDVADADREPLDAVAADVTDRTGIRLEYEAAYDWLAFVPLRDGDTGALTRYFGRRRDGGYKYRGIECRQRSTAPFVADCQRDLIEAFDRYRDPAAVTKRLAGWLDRLDAGDVDPDNLAIRHRTSKAPAAYTRQTRTAAALQRAGDQGIDRAAGQDVRYVVVDDGKSNRDRVRLAHESGDEYDAAFYRDRLLRAAGSVLSPAGWQQADIEAALADREETTLSQFT